MRKLFLTSKLNYSTYWTYDTITFKLFFDIVTSGDIKLMVKEGLPDKNLESKWLELIQENAKQTQDLTLVHQRNDFQALNYNIAEFILVRSALLKLYVVVDDECLDLLKQKGYNIRAVKGETKDFEYAKDLAEAVIRSDNLLAKVTRKQMEITRKYSSDKPTIASYGDIIAELNIQLGFVTPRDLTLSEFNGYRKILKAKNKR